MKVKLILLAMAAMMLPSVASAQLITSTITVSEKSAFEARYEQSIELPIVTDFEGDSSEINYFGINYIGGCRFGNLFFLGAGIGIDINYTYETSILIPFYLHTRLYFTDTRCQPFFAFSIGGLFNSYYIDNDPVGFIVNPVVGLNFRIDGDFNVYFSTGPMGYINDGLGLAMSFNLGVTF